MGVNYNVFTTNACNLNCDYCNGMRGYELLPLVPSYKIEDLKRFLSGYKYKKGEDLNTITFYGGEPLLNIEFMLNVMDEINAYYMLQTNGTLLYKIPPQYLRRFNTILISIDGNRAATDMHRGNGTYDLIIKNMHMLRRVDASANAIARITVGEGTNIKDSVTHLYETGLFSSFHWQLDTHFETGGVWSNSRGWSVAYNRHIEELSEWWIKKMEEEKKVARLYPFVGITDTLLNNTCVDNVRCGAGTQFFNIATNGAISACPDLVNHPEYYLGGILSTSPNKISGCIEMGKPCLDDCEDIGICGGRCLMANRLRIMGEDGFRQVCDTVKHLIETMKKARDRILPLIKDGAITVDDFWYQKNNGCEVIP